jgi:hypothetical protein
MRTVIANAFSVNMLKQDTMLFFAQIDLETAKYYVNTIPECSAAYSVYSVYSIVGHQATADLLSAKLGCNVSFNRENYKKEKDDRIIVCLPAQRLDEGQILSVEELNRINVKFWLIK